jgi:hypothetical protein
VHPTCSTSAHACVLAGVLCALALTSKVSAGWAPIAITVWLAIRVRRRVPIFLGVLAVSAGVLFSLFQAMSHGRMLESFRVALFADTGGSGSLLAPLRLFQLMADAAEATAILFPVALVGVVLAAVRREATLYDLILVCALLVLSLRQAKRDEPLHPLIQRAGHGAASSRPVPHCTHHPSHGCTEIASLTQSLQPGCRVLRARIDAGLAAVSKLGGGG